MLKRTARPFYGDTQSRMHRHADALMKAPLGPGETFKDREGAAMELRHSADHDMHKRRTMERPRKCVQGQARRAVAIPRQQTGHAQNKRERIACVAAVKRAHDPKMREPTGKQRRAAERAERKTRTGYGVHKHEQVAK